jgi:two-component system sensor histidine kinase KdpD
MSSSSPINAKPGDGHPPARRGRLKVFLGYAAGVGKTFRMLEEGQQLKRQNADVVVGYFEPHGRKDTIAKAAGLEFIPRRAIFYRGSAFQEMDTPAILQRRPAVCLVDEMAHTNVPGTERTKRWEDVRLLLDAGIDIYTTLNVQHLESLNDQIFQISGVRVRETVPDWVVKQAEEVVMVDATTGALLNRLKRGDIYEAAKAQRAMENFFKESTLAALREMALRQAAYDLEFRDEEAAQASAVTRLEPQAAAPSTAAPPPATKDRILIYVTSETSALMLIRRGRRMADYLGADCFTVYVCPHPDISSLPKEECERVERILNFARSLQIETLVLQGKNPAQSVVDFARRNQITQILLARPRYTWWTRLLRSDLILQVVRKARDVRVVIVAERRRPQ